LAKIWQKAKYKIKKKKESDFEGFSIARRLKWNEKKEKIRQISLLGRNIKI
jgi:hypothetical protein